jgi:hypothetical protein
MQYFFPAWLFAGYFFFPESAYYLLSKGKVEAAKEALRRTHGGDDQEFLDIEIKRIERNVQISEEYKKENAFAGPAYYQCFRGTNLVSLFLVLLIHRDAR